MTERTYVLGTHDAEVERLGVQHRVWRARVLDCWQRAGIGAGQHVLDVGCGPGYAALDLSRLVGERGSVLGLERSERFVAAARRAVSESGLRNVEVRQLDLVTDAWDVSGADATWCRWVLAFVTDPALVLRKIATALRPGGRAVFHEYFDYRSWRVGPRSEAFEKFVSIVVENWRASGGEPDIGLALPEMLDRAGFRLVSAEPVVYVVRPDEPMWEWPDSFVRVHVRHLAEAGRLEASLAREVESVFDRAPHTPGAFLITPAVLEVIAERT